MSIFQDNTRSLPKKDSQIVRVNFEQSDIGGRKDHMPSEKQSGVMGIKHIPNAGTKE